MDRFGVACERLPKSESIFREAADSLRVMLYHKARAGIRRQAGGAELDPASLSRYDRQVLKSGFESILRLLEFTAACRWLDLARPHADRADGDDPVAAGVEPGGLGVEHDEPDLAQRRAGRVFAQGKKESVP